MDATRRHFFAHFLNQKQNDVPPFFPPSRQVLSFPSSSPSRTRISSHIEAVDSRGAAFSSTAQPIVSTSFKAIARSDTVTQKKKKAKKILPILKQSPGPPTSFSLFSSESSQPSNHQTRCRSRRGLMTCQSNSSIASFDLKRSMVTSIETFPQTDRPGPPVPLLPFPSDALVPFFFLFAFFFHLQRSRFISHVRRSTLLFF